MWLLIMVSTKINFFYDYIVWTHIFLDFVLLTIKINKYETFHECSNPYIVQKLNPPENISTKPYYILRTFQPNPTIY